MELQVWHYAVAILVTGGAGIWATGRFIVSSIVRDQLKEHTEQESLKFDTINSELRRIEKQVAVHDDRFDSVTVLLTEMREDIKKLLARSSQRRVTDED